MLLEKCLPYRHRPKSLRHDRRRAMKEGRRAPGQQAPSAGAVATIGVDVSLPWPRASAPNTRRGSGQFPSRADECRRHPAASHYAPRLPPTC